MKYCCILHGRVFVMSLNENCLALTDKFKEMAREVLINVSLSIAKVTDNVVTTGADTHNK